MDERLEILAEIICDVFDDTDIEITEDTDLKSIDGWDSLVHISLMAAVQEEFGIKYDIDEMTEITTVADILDSIERKA